MMRVPSGRLRSIDLLRGTAVLAVLLTHLHFSWSVTPSRAEDLDPAFLPLATFITGYGRYGVGLFLVISGFCIHLGWARLPSQPPIAGFVSFWRRRLVRLYPPYLVALIATVLGLVALYGVILGIHEFPRSVGYSATRDLVIDLASLLLLAQNVTGAYERIGNTPFWTLALEEQLYLLYFALLAVRWRAGWKPALVVIICITFLWRAAAFVFTAPQFPWYALGPARWIEWALGAVAVEHHVGRIALPAWASSGRVGAALLALAVLVNVPNQGGWDFAPTVDRIADPVYDLAFFFGDIAFGVAFFVLLNAVVRRDRDARLGAGWIIRSLTAVGLFSYSLYLTHEPTVVAAKYIGLRLGLHQGVVETIAVTTLRFALAIVVARLFYSLVEIHAVRASQATARRTRAQVALAGQA